MDFPHGKLVVHPMATPATSADPAPAPPSSAPSAAATSSGRRYSRSTHSDGTPGVGGVGGGALSSSSSGSGSIAITVGARRTAFEVDSKSDALSGSALPPHIHATPSSLPLSTSSTASAAPPPPIASAPGPPRMSGESPPTFVISVKPTDTGSSSSSSSSSGTTIGMGMGSGVTSGTSLGAGAGAGAVSPGGGGGELSARTPFHILGPTDAKRPTRDIRLTCGHFSMQGVRNEMEDKTTLLPHPQFNKEVAITDSEQRSFFAVYDGHGGDVSAEYCHLHVHMNLVNDRDFGRDATSALRNAVMKTDADFCAACRRIHLLTSSGTTAICAYLDKDILSVANVGDSRGVLCRAGKAVPVSIDHKPGRPEERVRIELLGGHIGTSEEEANGGRKKGCCQCLRRCFTPKRPLRVFPGGLSVSRTIGDISLKGTSLIISDPEMYRGQLYPEDECLILACDGVWDVMGNQQAVDVVRKYLDDPEEAARAVAKEAYRKGSTDNISVIVVVFHQSAIPTTAPPHATHHHHSHHGTTGGAGV